MKTKVFLTCLAYESKTGTSSFTPVCQVTSYFFGSLKNTPEPAVSSIALTSVWKRILLKCAGPSCEPAFFLSAIRCVTNDG